MWRECVRVQLSVGVSTMKTVLVLAGLVALAAGSFPLYKHEHVDTTKLDEKLVDFQHKVLSLFDTAVQPWQSEYYSIGKQYDIEKNIDKYSNPKIVHEFLSLYRVGFTPQFYLFSIFQEKQREEAVLLYELFYSAKDFETLYNTAAFAKVHLNEGQFLYALYTALIQRADTQGIVLPSPYELWPEYFVNMEVLYRIFATQVLNGDFPEDVAVANGIFKQDNTFYYYYNYSDAMSYENNEHRLAYFTEDIGWNSFYYYFHTIMPFWSSGEAWGPYKERRGEIYYYFYQQLLSRYYLERLSNGLGEIPKFSWFAPLKVGYYPYLTQYYYPFVQRNDYYYMGTPRNEEYIQFVDTYEKSFLQFIQTGQFKAFKHEVDFRNSKSINFVGNFWQGNPDLYEKEGRPRNYERSYEQVARQLLGAAPEPYDQYTFLPTALDFYQTSLRDPVFYQLYGKIINYIIEYKGWLEPYTRDNLHYVGVKINDIQVDDLVTYFEYYDFNITNAMYFSSKGSSDYYHNFIVRQPRLNHKPFTVTFDIKSDVASEVVIKLFMAPKYDGEGRLLTLEENYMNFVELDCFTHKLTNGQNKIQRKSDEFFFYKDDSVPTAKIYELLKQGLVPEDMSEDYHALPRRLMLPRGTPGGFPVQFFAFVYQYEALKPEYEAMKDYVVDNKPLGYPFDRPISVPQYFYQPNMYFQDVYIYQHGPEYPWWNQYNTHFDHHNAVPKH
ncbi:arylphorin-like [Amyelois transitella]|uniref:arylphorin-like n=1 Tax=Amyelois transitella TaxID=680683 RepID=UPI002990683B|nr:arylphorin-like [Amyelois transitella]